MPKPKPRNDRGDYRSFYVSFWDDPDLHALSDRAYRVLTTLKGVLPATGIGVVYDLQLCQRCRCTPRQLEAAYRELEERKPESRYGWVVRERNLVWIVNGLKYEPTLNPDNTAKHVPFVRRLVSQLGERRRILDLYRQHYPEWFGTAPNVTERIPDTVGVGYRNGTDRLSEHSDSDSHNNSHKDSDSDKADPSEAVSIPHDPDPLGVQSAPARPAPRVGPMPEVQRFLETFYDPHVNSTENRRIDVARQLYDSVDPERPRGTRIHKGLYVKARSEAHLEECCRTLIDDPDAIREPDKAIVILLKMLTNPPPGPSPAEVRAYGETELVAREEAYHRAMRIAGLEWARQNPEEFERIRRPIDSEFPGSGGEVMTVARNAALAQATARAAGFPSFEEWSTRNGNGAHA